MAKNEKQQTEQATNAGATSGGAVRAETPPSNAQSTGENAEDDGAKGSETVAPEPAMEAAVPTGYKVAKGSSLATQHGVLGPDELVLTKHLKDPNRLAELERRGILVRGT